MAQGEFLWCDLATYGVGQTLDFYRQLFDWRLKPEEFADGSIYYYALNENDVTAGIYEMPDAYKNEQMESFWMSYVGVDDIMASVEVAKRAGGKLLLGPATFGNNATIALIEDPFGARFTFFSGSHLQPRPMHMVAGANFWNELFTPDPKASAEFYREVLGWKISGPDRAGRWRVNNLADQLTTAIQSNEQLTGPDTRAQWVVGFACENLEKFKKTAKMLNGGIIDGVQSAPGSDVFITDLNGAVFFVSEVNDRRNWFA